MSDDDLPITDTVLDPINEVDRPKHLVFKDYTYSSKIDDRSDRSIDVKHYVFCEASSDLGKMINSYTL